MGTDNLLYKVNNVHAPKRNPTTSLSHVTEGVSIDNETSIYSLDPGVTLAASSRSVQILIVAYIRSGSSLTGDILQQDPNSFYVYEPLHFTEKMGSKVKRVQLLNGKLA